MATRSGGKARNLQEVKVVGMLGNSLLRGKSSHNVLIQRLQCCLRNRGMHIDVTLDQL